jgi:nucleotide-binding universal stress UspA family protein
MNTSRNGNRDRDRGGRVIVGVDSSLGSLGALRQAVAEARQRGAQLCAVRVVSQELSWVGALCDDDLAVLHRQIQDAFQDALGEVPSDLETRSLVLVGAAGRALVDFTDREDDLLVVGAGERGRPRRWWHWSVSAYCVRHARCPVLSVPLPEFARTMRRVRLPRRRVGLDELLDA